MLSWMDEDIPVSCSLRRFHGFFAGGLLGRCVCMLLYGPFGDRGTITGRQVYVRYDMDDGITL